MMNIIWGIVVLLVVLWILGFALHVGGAFVHVLLVLALVAVVINLVSGRRATA
jgi:hypothetical protein